MLSFLFYTLSFTTVLADDVLKPLENDIFLSDEFVSKFGVLTSDQKNYSLVDNLDVESKLRWEYATKSGQHIGVYDNVLTSAHLKLLRALITFNLGSWSYRIHESDVKGGQDHVSKNDIPWYNELDVMVFSQSIVGKQVQKVLAKFSHENSMNYYPFNVVGHIMRRGDFPKVHTDSEESEVSMMIYLNSKWRKNDYGDLYLYDDDKEIVAGVVPRHGRIVVWQSTIPYLPRPPSIAFKPGQLFLHICFTKNKSKVQDIHSKWQKNRNIHMNIHQKGFFTTEESEKYNEIEVQSHLVSEAKSKNGQKIVVFDGLFSKEDLDNLRSAILNYGVYYYDDSYDEESDNVQWIAGFKVDHYIKSNLWKITKQVAVFVSGGHVAWFPYDVSCNLIRNADTTQIHHDCEKHEGEWTFLLYLNPEWTINDYGETVFYEKNDDHTEIITEVLPKYGRVVIFQGIIPHSARPPSTNFTGARLSFAVKLSKNELIGRRKAIKEEFRHFSAAKTNIGAFKKLFVNEEVSIDLQNDHPSHDHNNRDQEEQSDNELKDEESDDEESDDEESDDDEDTEMMFADSELKEMKDKIETLSTKEDTDINDLRTLFKDLQRRRFELTHIIDDLLQRHL